MRFILLGVLGFVVVVVCGGLWWSRLSKEKKDKLKFVFRKNWVKIIVAFFVFWAIIAGLRILWDRQGYVAYRAGERNLTAFCEDRKYEVMHEKTVTESVFDWVIDILTYEDLQEEKEAKLPTAYLWFREGLEKHNVDCYAYYAILCLSDIEVGDLKNKIDNDFPTTNKEERDVVKLNAVKAYLDQVVSDSDAMRCAKQLIKCEDLKILLKNSKNDLSYDSAKNIYNALNEVIDDDKLQKINFSPAKVKVLYYEALAYYQLALRYAWSQNGGWEIAGQQNEQQWSDFDQNSGGIYMNLCKEKLEELFKCYTQSGGNSGGDDALLEALTKWEEDDSSISLEEYVDSVLKDDDKDISDALKTTEDALKRIEEIDKKPESSLDVANDAEVNKTLIEYLMLKEDEKVISLWEDTGWYAKGLYLLGVWYWHYDVFQMDEHPAPEPTEENDLMALKLWETAAMLGDGEAMEQLSEIYYYGIERYRKSEMIGKGLQKYQKDSNSEENNNESMAAKLGYLSAKGLNILHGYTILARIYYDKGNKEKSNIYLNKAGSTGEYIKKMYEIGEEAQKNDSKLLERDSYSISYQGNQYFEMDNQKVGKYYWEEAVLQGNEASAKNLAQNSTSDEEREVYINLTKVLRDINYRIICTLED